MSESVHLVCPACQQINRMPWEKTGEDPKCGQCKNPLLPAQPIEVNSAALQRFVQHETLPILIDFWAPWCGPCKAFAPTFAEAARRLHPQIRLLKINTEAHQDAATAFNIRSIPSLVFLQGGQEIDRVSGALPLNQLLQWLMQFAQQE